jgi:hypothetical protein
MKLTVSAAITSSLTCIESGVWVEPAIDLTPRADSSERIGQN